MTTNDSVAAPDAVDRSRMVLRTLGTMELVDLVSGSILLPRGKPLALLAYCCIARRREYSREALAALLWSDAPAERARHNVRQALWRIRKQLGDVLETRDDSVLGIAPGLTVDREQFLDAVYRSDAPEALRLYQGPFLDGVTMPGGAEFDDWAAAERLRLEDALVRVSEPYLRSELLLLKPRERREVLEQLLQKAPDHHEARRVAIEVLLDIGDRAAAQREADTLERMAQAIEVDLNPAAASAIARARELKATEPSADAPTMEFDLVGRDEIFGRLVSIWSAARQGGVRVVLLTGVAGVGKTRLLKSLHNRCVGRRSRALTVRCNPGERDVPFGFAAMLTRALAHQPGAAGINPDSARELVALDPGLASRYAVTPAGHDGGETLRRRALAVVDLLSAVAEQEPMALLMDDLHWADPASRQLLEIVVGRISDVPLLIVGACRPMMVYPFEHSTLAVMSLPPLSVDTIAEAVRSSGVWPDTPAVDHFIDVISDASDGLPLSVMERLTLAQDRGLLSRHEGNWTSPDWTAAANAVTVASPIERRLADSSERERDVMLMLAVAGTPLPESILQFADASTDHSDERISRVLASLDGKNLIVCDQGLYQTSHDLITEYLLANSASEAVRAAHRQLARALARSGAADRLVAALRHFLQANELAEASAVFARIMIRARRSGDPRHARDILGDQLGEHLSEPVVRQLLRSVPLTQRAARLAARTTALLASLLTIATIGISWRVLRKPPLQVTQMPVLVVPTPIFGPETYRLVPALTVRRPSPSGSPRSAGATVRVRSLRPTVTILSGDEVVTEGDIASFGALRLLTSDTLIALQVESEGQRPLQFELKRTFESKELKRRSVGAWLAEAQFGAHRLRGPDAEIRVAPGELIAGVVQMQYDALWPAASVWASMTPTWGDPAEVGRELTPLATPTRNEVVDLPVSVVAPSERGNYWLLFMVDAEPSGMFGLSRTNWTVGVPIWDDDNDLARLTDSSILHANRTGIATTEIALPETWSRVDVSCRSPRNAKVGRIKYCKADLGLFGIRVIVR